MKKQYLRVAIAAMAIIFSACGAKTATDVMRVDALDASAWEASKWISVVDAPVVTGKTGDMENNRAADGANWFVSTVKNEQKVVHLTSLSRLWRGLSYWERALICFAHRCRTHFFKKIANF